MRWTGRCAGAPKCHVEFTQSPRGRSRCWLALHTNAVVYMRRLPVNVGSTRNMTGPALSPRMDGGISSCHGIGGNAFGYSRWFDHVLSVFIDNTKILHEGIDFVLSIKLQARSFKGLPKASIVIRIVTDEQQLGNPTTMKRVDTFCQKCEEFPPIIKCDNSFSLSL